MQHSHSREETTALAPCFNDDALMDSALPALSDLAFDFEEGSEVQLSAASPCSSAPTLPPTPWRREIRMLDEHVPKIAPTDANKIEVFVGFCLNA